MLADLNVNAIAVEAIATFAFAAMYLQLPPAHQGAPKLGSSRSWAVAPGG
jgi:hypothetical protein